MVLTLDVIVKIWRNRLETVYRKQYFDCWLSVSIWPRKSESESSVVFTQLSCSKQHLIAYSVSLEPTAKPEIDSCSLEGRNATIRWSLIGTSREATGFLVQLNGPHGERLWEETTLLNVLSIKLYNLEYHRDYQVVVRLINCGSHGPPSKPHHIHIYKQGKQKSCMSPSRRK